MRYKAKQFIGIVEKAKPITEFDADLYYIFVEKITVRDDGFIVSLLDGTEMECKFE